MLSMLRVENLSVIESVTVEFDKGLNIITGETGAGKSVFIGALNLVLGARFNRALFRDPEKKLVVEAEFTDISHLDEELKDQFEIETDIIIRREIDKTGKNRIFINGRMATVEQLKQLAFGFCDIHGQHEHQMLLDSATHIAFIDALVEPSLKDRYAETFERYNALEKDISRIRNNRQQILKEKDMLEFQLNEIESMNIDIEEDCQIDEKVGILSNMEKILESAAGALGMLRDGEINAYDLISSASTALEGVASYSGDLETASSQLTEATYLINDAIAGVEKVADRQDLDPAELDTLMDRKYRLANLTKKYGPTLEDVVRFGEETAGKLDDINFGQDNLDKLQIQLDDIYAELAEDAKVLNLRRGEIARKIEEKVIESLDELELKNCVFTTVFEEAEKLDAMAGVRAEFYISTNPGFEPGPLTKVASGGEISRVMLSLKEVFAVADRVDTLVFDEVDTGISGRTAKKVAIKLKKVAEARQVIVITHLPVVASAGSRHFHITKSLDGAKAKTNIGLVEEEERLKVLASMLTGEVTQSAIQQAKQMIEDMVNA
ncbi:DNA repair protein RecN [Denitrovibrio acetiphilus DSM 12809]|uniref:DNA repair protein RecN n=1 Tax=Denitrovibrio acetiphilus (strain DSM 12809 / NBRC 114555 / N2460) TaxID=522772 RepID=D4H0Z8_DENA2|nr:DNA repair protein RecN [Denitrovibrio acetiphilus]ADD68661.1 DNA repair protein RecN [Denitrovibrio acetiphilus DSM 12809]